MAKLNAPLLSLGATQSIGKTLTFFPWKGLNVARQYVVPANPKTTKQTTQRGHITSCVTLVHTAMSSATNALNSADKAAYSLLAATQGIVMTWFNAVVRQGVKQLVAAKQPACYRGGVMTPSAGGMGFSVYFSKLGANSITAGDVWFGTSKSALLTSMAATVAADHLSAAITGLTPAVKYYFQFRATAHVDYLLAKSGIYYGTPT